MQQPNKNKWKTKIRLPLLDEVTCKKFMEMSYAVAKLYGVKDAYWSVEDLGDNYYELTAEYEIRPFVPIKKKQIKLQVQ